MNRPANKIQVFGVVGLNPMQLAPGGGVIRNRGRLAQYFDEFAHECRMIRPRSRRNHYAIHYDLGIHKFGAGGLNVGLQSGVGGGAAAF